MNGPWFRPLGSPPLMFLTAQVSAGIGFPVGRKRVENALILQVVPGDLGLDLTRGRWVAAFEDLWGIQTSCRTSVST